MDRTVQTLSSLRETNLKANQEAIAELTYLLKFGSTELDSLFSATLRGEAGAIEPLRYITKGEPFPPISEKTSSRLRIINSYMTYNLAPERRPGEDPQTVIQYSNIRGPYLSTSLQNLASASITTARKADPNALYMRGNSGIGHYSLALDQMFSAEYDSICPIFAREQWVRVHGLTCSIALKELTNVLSELYQHIQHHVLTDCYLGFEICEVVSSLSFKLESKNPEMRQPVQDALRPVREQAKYSLQRLYEDTKARTTGIMAIQGDASPVQVTDDVMARLKNMTSFMQPLSSILASIGDGGWRTSGAPNAGRLDVGVNGTELFGTYCGDTMDALLGSLEHKCKTLMKTPSAQGIFLANNVAVVERAIMGSELEGFINDTARNKLEVWRKRAVILYTSPWKDAAMNLRDVQYTNRSSGGNRPPSNSISGSVDSATYVRGMSSKDKDATKEKFKSFNSTFDDLVARHRQFRCEPIVREQVLREVESLVEPLYDRFWDRYHEIDKGKGKYVKHSKESLRSVLRGMVH